MSVAVVELIAVELLRRLNLMVGTSTYNTEVVEAIRPPRHGTWTPQHLQIVMTQGGSEIVDELSYPGNPPAVARRQTFNIRCHVLSDEKDTTAIETVLNTFAADVVKVVTSVASWWQFGGNSVDATWLPHEEIAADGGIDGVNVPIAILYRTDETSPYVVRT